MQIFSSSVQKRPHFWLQLFFGIIAVFSVSVQAQTNANLTEFRHVYQAAQLHAQNKNTVQDIFITELSKPSFLKEQKISKIHSVYITEKYQQPLYYFASIRAGPMSLTF